MNVHVDALWFAFLVANLCHWDQFGDPSTTGLRKRSYFDFGLLKQLTTKIATKIKIIFVFAVFSVCQI